MGIAQNPWVPRDLLFLAGAVLLFGYGLSLNLAPIEFGRVAGLYIATLFIVWQIVNFVAFRSVPSTPILLGGAPHCCRKGSLSHSGNDNFETDPLPGCGRSFQCREREHYRRTPVQTRMIRSRHPAASSAAISRSARSFPPGPGLTTITRVWRRSPIASSLRRRADRPAIMAYPRPQPSQIWTPRSSCPIARPPIE
jgi:hypothetical protein